MTLADVVVSKDACGNVEDALRRADVAHAAGWTRADQAEVVLAAEVRRLREQDEKTRGMYAAAAWDRECLQKRRDELEAQLAFTAENCNVSSTICSRSSEAQQRRINGLEARIEEQDASGADMLRRLERCHDDADKYQLRALDAEAKLARVEALLADLEKHGNLGGCTYKSAAARLRTALHEQALLNDTSSGERNRTNDAG